MVEPIILIDGARFIIGACILSYASYTDIKTRKASNILWLIMGGAGAILLCLQYVFVGFSNILYLIFIPIMIGLMYVFFQFRLIFGGADAKAIMSLSVLTPFQISFMNFPVWSSPLPYSWVIFSNSILLFLFIPLSLFVYNIINRNIQFPYCFCGYKMPLEKARTTFVWPLEKIVNGKQKFSYFPKDFDANQEFDQFEKAGITSIWVTPKIPFMIPLLAGFLCAFSLGDILSFLFSHIR